MGVVKLPKRVAAKFSFFCDVSRVELGAAFGLLVTPRRGRCRARRRSRQKSECCGAGSSGRVLFGLRLTSGMRSAIKPLTVQPAIRVRLFFGAAHIMPLCGAWSRQASAPNLPASVCPRAKPGARRLPKLRFLKSRFCLVRSWRVQDQAKLLGRGATGAHFPNID
jgi:hypothetical protein